MYGNFPLSTRDTHICPTAEWFRKFEWVLFSRNLNIIEFYSIWNYWYSYTSINTVKLFNLYIGTEVW